MDTTVNIPALPMCDIEVRVELILTDRPQRATWWEPGHGGAVELGTIEVHSGYATDWRGKRVWEYRPLPNNDDGNAIEAMIRRALESDERFMQDALTEALTEAASDREEAMERRWEERREMRAMEALR